MVSKGTIPPESVLASKLMGEKRINNFDFSEPQKSSKWVGTVAGIKNAGKTSNAINMYRNALVIDFDGNAPDNKDTLISRGVMKEEDIFIVNGRKYLSERPTPNEYMLNYLYIKEACRRFKGKYSGVIVDTIDGLEELLVEKARYLYGSGPTENGTKSGLTWQGWADRSATLTELWQLFLDCAIEGVTYITDYRFLEKVEKGKSITIQVPKWFDIIRRESRYLIEIDQFPDFVSNQVVVKAKVWGSKNERFVKPATEIDITGYKPVFDKMRLSQFFSGTKTLNNITNETTSKPEASGETGGITW